jgi:hypothetical protein
MVRLIGTSICRSGCRPLAAALEQAMPDVDDAQAFSRSFTDAINEVSAYYTQQLAENGQWLQPSDEEAPDNER